MTNEEILNAFMDWQQKRNLRIQAEANQSAAKAAVAAEQAKLETVKQQAASAVAAEQVIADQRASDVQSALAAVNAAYAAEIIAHNFAFSALAGATSPNTQVGPA